MVGPNCSSKSAQCGQWKSSYKVIVTVASDEPRGMGWPLVMVIGLAETDAEGTVDGARPVRQAWNAIPPATTITTNAAIIMIKIRRSRFRAAACSVASRARSRAFLFLGPLIAMPPSGAQLPDDQMRTGSAVATPATTPAAINRNHERSQCRTRFAQAPR